MRKFLRAIADGREKKEQRKINSRTGGGDLIAEDQRPGPSPGPAFVVPDRDRHGFCGSPRVLFIAHSTNHDDKLTAPLQGYHLSRMNAGCNQPWTQSSKPRLMQ